MLCITIVLKQLLCLAHSQTDFQPIGQFTHVSPKDNLLPLPFWITEMFSVISTPALAYYHLQSLDPPALYGGVASVQSTQKTDYLHFAEVMFGDSHETSLKAHW